jgi:hypothetical protein
VAGVTMDVAVIGWGSLVCCPGSLRIRTRWRRSGPVLPIEFARISGDDRLTLVICPGLKKLQTYWALSEFTDLKGARENLRDRENATKLDDIHFASVSGDAAEDSPQEVRDEVGHWLESRPELHAAIWTGLASNWEKKRGHDFTVDDAVRYLKELEAARERARATCERAKEYVRNAPELVQIRQAHVIPTFN